MSETLVEKADKALSLENVGVPAIGERLSFRFEADVIVFPDRSLPGGTALCLERSPYLQLPQPIQAGEKMNFSPIDGDGYLVTEPRTYTIDSSTRLMRRKAQHLYPYKVLVQHSTTLERARQIREWGLYSRGEAALNLVPRGTEGPGVEFLLPGHEIVLVFEVPLDQISYSAAVGQADGLAIYPSVSSKEIPPEVLKVVLLERLAIDGVTHYLDKKLLLPVAYKRGSLRPIPIGVEEL